MVVALLVSGCHRSEPAAPAPAPAPVQEKGSGGEGEDRAATRSLQVMVNGKAGEAWTPVRINAVAPLQVTNRNGESRGGWSLKALTSKLAGPTARVVALDAGPQRLEIAAADWSDAKRTLVVRVTRRGEYKVHWAAADGNVGDAVLKGVERVEIAQ